MRNSDRPSGIEGTQTGASAPTPCGGFHQMHIGRETDAALVLQTVLANVDMSIFVSDAETDELLFASRHLDGDREKCADFDGDCAKCTKDRWERRYALCQATPGRVPRRREGETADPAKPLVRELQNSSTGDWFLVTDSAVDWADGRTASMQTAVNITRLKQKEEALRQDVMMDRMTGTYNRAGGYSVLKAMLEDAARAGLVSCLCFLDLDGLKQVNDCHGHDAGDDLILSFIDAIRASTRTSDILCRWGGDEFLLLLHDCGIDQAEKIMCKIATEFEKFGEIEHRPYEHKFSYGIVVIDPEYDDTDLDRFISAADVRMYHNKKTRRENIRAAI